MVPWDKGKRIKYQERDRRVKYTYLTHLSKYNLICGKQWFICAM